MADQARYCPVTVRYEWPEMTRTGFAMVSGSVGQRGLAAVRLIAALEVAEWHRAGLVVRGQAMLRRAVALA